MGRDPKVTAAFQAMTKLGISQQKVKPVLKSLLRLYEKNWALIEEDNYRVLLDAIFEPEDNATEQTKKRGKTDSEDDAKEELEEELGHEPERPLKRLRLRGREVTQSPVMAKSPDSRADGCQVSHQNALKDKGKQIMFAEKCLAPFVPPVTGKGLVISERTEPHSMRPKDPSIETAKVLSKNKAADSYQLIEPKDEPFADYLFTNDIPQYNTPISVIHPDPVSEKGLQEIANGRKGRNNDMENRVDDPKESETRPIHGETFPNLDVATSRLGEVKLSLSCDSAVGSRIICMPTLNDVIKLTEEKCLRAYKITDPTFSVSDTLRHVCESFLELGTDILRGSQDRPNGTKDVLSDVDAQKVTSPLDPLEVCRENAGVSLNPSNDLVGNESDAVVTALREIQGDDAQCSEEIHGAYIGSAVKNNDGKSEDPNPTNACSLVVFPQNELDSNLRSLADVEDITKGEESVRIPFLNEINYECPALFRYMSQSLIFQNAKLDISLSGIGETSCCSTCIGDCVSAPVPCACAKKTGGEFAYTSEGVVKEDFLEECISTTRDPTKQSLTFCEECPLEKQNNDDLFEPCKGHLKKKFIKECWKKCGCNKKCGNRIVQRGMTHNLQVFYTSDERGWGLRTLEELPIGTFVCEYVGEILTTTEARERESAVRCDKSIKNTYIALLDADWGSKRTVKDERALCLDSSQFGNAARFINHRCLDANLVEIPVEVETPNHYYYHAAFFTTRKVDALEELTWDYGIDFDDDDHPIKPFACRCGSKFCRNIKRQNRLKLTPTASKSGLSV